MDHLYTPWRMGYLRGEQPAERGCIFCSAPAGEDADALIVARSEYVYVILNKFPYNNGHVMVVPYEHIGSQELLAEPALLDLMLTANRTMAVLREVYRPAAFNVGANIGAAAGAGIAGHFHLHIVPRWAGDANFMTVVSDTRVIADTLQNTQRELAGRWPRTQTEQRGHE